MKRRRQHLGVLGLLFLTAGANGCTGREPASFAAPDPAAAMLGVWLYTDQLAGMPGQPALGGLHVTLSLTEATGTTIRGAVLSWFSGDIGIDPATFGPVAGTVELDGNVALIIPTLPDGGPSIALDGRLAGDSLVVMVSSLGVSEGPFPAGALFVRGSMPAAATAR